MLRTRVLVAHVVFTAALLAVTTAILAFTAAHAQQTFVPLTEDAAPTRHIHGYVLDPEGAPVVGAIITADDNLDDTITPYSTVADRRGRFALEIAEGDRYISISAHDDRYARPSYDTTLQIGVPIDPAQLPVTLRLLTPTSFSGTVLDPAGKRLSEARIYIASTMHELTVNDHGERYVREYEGKTDSEGKFSMTRLPRSPEWFVIDHPDHASHSYSKEDFPANGLFRLTEGGTVRGCVLNAAGEHVAGVNVVVHGDRLNDFDYGPWYAVSEDDGSLSATKLSVLDYFHKRKEQSAFTLMVNDQRFQEDIYRLYLDEDGALPFVEVTLRPTGSLPKAKEFHVGRKTAPNEATVALRANVPLEPDEEGRFPVVDLDRLSRGEPRYSESEQFNEKGVAQFSGLPPGNYRATVRAKSQGFAPKEFSVTGGHHEITLEAGAASLVGHVEGLHEEDPAPELYWYVSAAGNSIANGGVTVSADGTFEVASLPLGECSMYLYNIAEKLTLQPGENRIVLTLPDGEIRGNVSGVELPRYGDDPPEVRVMEAVDDLAGSAYSTNTIIQHDGTFVVRHVPPGRYEVQAFGRIDNEILPLTEVVDLTAVSSAYVELRPPDVYGKIEGRVIGLPQGLNEFNAPYVAAHHSGQAQTKTRYSQVDATGRYHINRLAPGRYGLSLSGDDLPHIFIPDIEVQPEMITRVDLEIADTRPIFFRFTSKIPFARVALRVLVPDAEFSPVSMSMSNIRENEKHYEVELPYGDYILEARFGDPPGLHTVPFTVPPGDSPLEVHVPYGE